MKPMIPRNATPCARSAAVSASGTASSRFVPKPSTRSPSAAASAIRASQGPGSAPDIASTASGAPLTKTAISPEGPRCSVAMKRCAASKGISSSRGHSARAWAGSSPAFIAAATSAPSIGSPSTRHPPCVRRSAAPLHSSPQRKIGAAAASAAASSSAPSATSPPSGA